MGRGGGLACYAPCDSPRRPARPPARPLAAQPALVYIVPCMLLTVVGLALKRNELWRIWRYTDTTPAVAKKKGRGSGEEEQGASARQQR